MACNYKPAAMKHRVTLQALVRTPDGQGGFTEVWEEDADLWAQIQPLKGYERMQAQQLQTPITHKVMLRYRHGVSSAMRLQYGSKVLNIKEIINVDEASAYLQLLCVESALPILWENLLGNWESINTPWEMFR